ncbi:MAG TPA: hypothetical protein VLN45_11765 [Ignavibacteriaceae bacterium]|nr:hypothetical protein [Ignavibacteriaceae bacterium]
MSNYQNEKLQKLLENAFQNIPYYKKTILELGMDYKTININNINTLPFLTKDIIKKNNNELLNPNISPLRIIPNSTSGSSGNKTVFYSDAHSELFRAGLNWRSKKWVDLDIGNKELRIWGARFDVIKTNNALIKLRSFFRNKDVLSSYKLTPEIIKNYISFINEYKPNQIHAYPSSIFEISKFMIDNNLQTFKPIVILTSGEQLYEWQREIIERAFGVNVYNFYGCREVGIIAMECKEKKGLHIQAENIILEVVNEKGENIYDEEGEIVVTDLSNYVFPFIRYKILDRGILTKEKCACGVNLPLLKAVNGRTFDLVKLSNGGSIGATFFTHLFREKPGIEDFRIHQKNINEILIEYIPENGEVDTDYFKTKIQKYSDNLLDIIFTRTDKFITPDSGKKQFIKSFV